MDWEHCALGKREGGLMRPQDRFKRMRPRSVFCLSVAGLGSTLATHLAGQQLAPRDIAARARPAVVLVTALAGGQAIGQGSGFFVSSDGRLVTNRHVVEGADQLRVELSSGEVYDRVFFVSADERRDLVILRIPVSSSTPLSMIDERELAVGDPVYVIGNPMGLEGTFTDGLVSAKRTVDGVSLIQISAPISQGSSGGPVLNAVGEVVGIASSTVRDGQNLNMAVPARYAAGLLAMGEPPRPFEDVASELAATARSDASHADPARNEVEPWVRVLWDEMAAVDKNAKGHGLVSTQDPVVELIGQDSTYSVEYTFAERGDTVTIVGVCDIDCTDLDLAVYDGHGQLVVDDTEQDDRPVTQFVVLAPGTFRVQVHMVACKREPCGFAVQTYTGSGTTR